MTVEFATGGVGGGIRGVRGSVCELDVEIFGSGNRARPRS
jgi:hypothetical protein